MGLTLSQVAIVRTSPVEIELHRYFASSTGPHRQIATLPPGARWISRATTARMGFLCMLTSAGAGSGPGA